MKDISESILEEFVVGNITYEIAFIDMENYTFIKRIDRRVTHEDVSGTGHIVSHVLLKDKNDKVYYSILFHNEIGSTGKTVSKTIDKLTKQDELEVNKIIEDFNMLMGSNCFSRNAEDVYNDISNTFQITKRAIFK